MSAIGQYSDVLLFNYLPWGAGACFKHNKPSVLKKLTFPSVGDRGKNKILQTNLSFFLISCYIISHSRLYGTRRVRQKIGPLGACRDFFWYRQFVCLWTIKRFPTKTLITESLVAIKKAQDRNRNGQKNRRH